MNFNINNNMNMNMNRNIFNFNNLFLLSFTIFLKFLFDIRWTYFNISKFLVLHFLLVRTSFNHILTNFELCIGWCYNTQQLIL